MRFLLRPIRIALRSRTEGFTLVEVIVAMTILSIVLISVFEAYSNIVMMGKRLEMSRGLQQNARTIVETIAKDVRDGGIAFECYGSTSATDLSHGCNDGPHDPKYSGSGVSMLILKGAPDTCGSASECFVQYYLAEPATSGETDCVRPEEAGRCYISRRVVGSVPSADSVRLSDPLTSVTQLRFFLSGISAKDFKYQSDQEGKVTMVFNLSLAPRQGVPSDLAERLVIPIQTTITQKLYQVSH